MELLVQIAAPTFGQATGARARQFEWTNLAALLKLIASRIEMGQPQGHIEQAGITADFKIEQSPAAKSAETEAA